MNIMYLFVFLKILLFVDTLGEETKLTPITFDLILRGIRQLGNTSKLTCFVPYLWPLHMFPNFISFAKPFSQNLFRFNIKPGKRRKI